MSIKDEGTLLNALSVSELNTRQLCSSLLHN